MICNLGVVGSNPTRGSKETQRIGESQLSLRLKRGGNKLARALGLGVFQSGQMGQTVNLLSFDFGGSNPSAPTRETSKDVRRSHPFFICIRVRAREGTLKSVKTTCFRTQFGCVRTQSLDIHQKKRTFLRKTN